MYPIAYSVRRHGVFLGRTSERLVVKKDGEQLQQLSLRRLRSILIDARGVSLSSALIESCAEFGVEIFFLDFRNRAVSRLGAPHQNETVAAMRAQMSAPSSNDGVALAKRLIHEKLVARRRLLNYHKRRAPEPGGRIEQCLERISDVLKAVDALDGDAVAEVREQLMGLEGAASRRYWPAVATTIPDDAQFERREHRGAEDLVNRMLNYGYAILQSRVWTAVERAGMHPFGGVLHADRPGKPSMVLDLMEPWRILVEDAVFSALRRNRSKLPAQFDDRFKKIVVREVIGRLDADRDYRNKRLPTRECIVEAARNISVYLRGDGALRPFRWDVRGPKQPPQEE